MRIRAHDTLEFFGITTSISCLSPSSINLGPLKFFKFCKKLTVRLELERGKQ